MKCLPRQCRSLWVGLFLLFVLAGPLRAGIGLSVGSLGTDAWQVQELTLSLGDADPGVYQLALSVAQLTLPGGLGDWQAITLTCPALTLGGDGYRCAALQLQADSPYGRQQLQGELHYLDGEHWSLRLTGLQLAGGRWQVTAQADGGWQLALQGQGVTLDGVLALVGGAGLPAWDWRGKLGVQARLRGQGAQLTRLDADLSVKDASWASADGLQAGQSLAGMLRLQARHDGQAWQGDVKTDWAAGQVYSDPIYVELDKQPLGIAARLRWPEGAEALQLAELTARLGKLVTLKATGQLPLAAPLQGKAGVQVQLPDMAGLYPVLLQPLAYGGALGELDMAGAATLDLTWQGGQARTADVKLSGIHLDDRGGRFGLSDLQGQLHWLAEGEPQPSSLQWQSGHLYKIDLGGSRADLALAGDRVWLRGPLTLPVLEGALRIPSLTAAGLGGEQPSWRTALRAESLSLPALSKALDWPVLAGELSVEIPAVQYAAGTLSLDGELVAQAFDGTVRVTGLQLHEPLGPAPLFEAEASLRGLDLERVTRVFDLGRITGRLDGDVQGLQLVGWQPVAFEAVLQSPERDDLPHRISQRAVENLTELGNNGAAALSGTFLRVFESFGYDRLRLQVRLKGQRAELDGIAHPSGGYYLVKGAGLPRIDVIGRNREVAWRDLVERLRRIQLKGAQIR